MRIAQVAIFINITWEVEGVGSPEIRPVTGQVVLPVQLLCLKQQFICICRIISYVCVRVCLASLTDCS